MLAYSTGEPYKGREPRSRVPAGQEAERKETVYRGYARREEARTLDRNHRQDRGGERVPCDDQIKTGPQFLEPDEVPSKKQNKMKNGNSAR